MFHESLLCLIIQFYLFFSFQLRLLPIKPQANHCLPPFIYLNLTLFKRKLSRMENILKPCFCAVEKQTLLQIGQYQCKCVRERHWSFINCVHEDNPKNTSIYHPLKKEKKNMQQTRQRNSVPSLTCKL